MGTRPPFWHLQTSPPTSSAFPFHPAGSATSDARDAAVTLEDLGEQALIARIHAHAGGAPPWVTVGIGDDAAVIERERNELDVVTTDSLVEHVHFEQRFSDPSDVGHKALAVNLSDLAAMGARPRWALLTLALPPHVRVLDAEALVDGFLALAGRHKVSLIGGNISRSPGPIMVGVTAGGVVHRRGILRRDAARPGDELYVSGTIGAATAGLEWLRALETDPEPEPDERMIAGIGAHRRPEARVRLGMLLGRNRAASACMDLSDGLADAVRQIARASGVGARVMAEKVPVSAAARLWFERRGGDALAAALAGGDDYEMLIAVPKKLAGRFRAVRRLVGELPLTGIGTLTAEPGIVLVRGGREEAWPGGFSHF